MSDRSAIQLKSLGGLLLLVGALGACSERPWFAFTPADRSFHASFPFEPTKSMRTVTTAMGESDVTFYTATDSQIAYSVTVGEYSAEQIARVGAKGFLDEARNGAIANTHGKMTSETSFDVKGNPGREVAISVSGGKSSFRCRLILVGNRLFQVIVAGPSNEADGRSARRFLDSFSLS
jgi:hypothetical protein